MPWGAQTVNRIATAIDVLGVPTSFLYIRQQMDRTYDAAEAQAVGGGEDLVTRAEAYLTQIESYDTQLDTGAVNAGLIKADVLEWETGGGRLQGLRQERKRIVDRLIQLLNLDFLLQNRNQRIVLRT